MTVVEYPPAGEPNSWQDMLALARELDCILKLGGRSTAHRPNRGTVARLTVKGHNAYELFYLVMDRTRKVFGKKVILKVQKPHVDDLDLEGRTVPNACGNAAERLIAEH